MKRLCRYLLVLLLVFAPIASIAICGCGPSRSPEAGTQLETDESQQLEEDPEAEEAGVADESVESGGP